MEGIIWGLIAVAIIIVVGWGLYAMQAGREP